MDDFAHVQIEMQASIDSQTSMMHDLFDQFRINPDAEILQRFKLGEVTGAHIWVLTCLVSFPAFLVISSLVLLVGHITTVVMTASKYCFH
jgi:hypothetical protein